MLLILTLCATVWSIAALADPVKLSSVDITIELPKGGDYYDWSAPPTILSFKSGDIDLLANGAGFLKVQWEGEYDLDDNSTPYFRTGGSYTLTLQLMFGSGYCTNGTTAFTGETVVTPEIFSATINGVAATVKRNGSTYYPTITATLKLESEVLNAEQRAARNEEWEQVYKARRAFHTTPRTRAKAETYNRDSMPEKVVVVTDPEGRDLSENSENMTTVVFNVNTAEQMAEYISNSDYLKEIWLNPETDPYKFVNTIKKNQRSIVGGYNYWESSAAIPMYLSEATVFIPESRVSEFKQTIDEKSFNGYVGGAMTIKCYSGDDVIAAQKAGASAAKEICTEHKYTTQIKSADRVFHYADHNDHYLYYYSCTYCGKCEYDPNHVGYDIELVNLGYIKFDAYKASERHGTVYAERPADSVYIGINAAGEHVWRNSCHLCGMIAEDLNIYDQLTSVGNSMPFEEWKTLTIAGDKKLEEQALNSIERYYLSTFSLPLKSDAYMSEWAQSDVNLALNDDLLDTALLGNDYTQNITRLQFCSVAVKLAEALIDKEITPAPSDTFTDTADPYVLKAYAAGITSGTGERTFSPYATLTRQQMATFIYRVLRYVEQNSDYSYTDYISKLANYTDRDQVQPWAEETMASMNALDLIKGTTETTLNPDGICAIEQAVAVAERSVYAHLIGWYQVCRAKNMSPTSGLGKAKLGAWALREGNYVWVTGRRYGTKVSAMDERDNVKSLFVPIINPFNGQAAEFKYGDLVPVRN